MSTEYNVIVYDYPGVDRTPIRSQHLSTLPTIVNQGKVLSAGGLFKDETKTKLIGSAFHLLANNKQEIIDFLKQDIYYKQGIWNLDTVVINPIAIATRCEIKLPGVSDEVYKNYN